ncbi:MAG: hypothetical protein ACOCYU_02530 [Brevefilum sp.]
MNWTLIGWALIFISAILIIFSKFLPLSKTYPVRELPIVENLRKAQITTMERGEQRRVLLGDRIAPLAYPGLGLQALSALPSFLDRESAIDGGLTLGSADGGLVVFARQIVQNRYRDGFSPVLHQAGVRTMLYGPTPLSFTAGILPELAGSTGGSLTLFGHYGPEAMLWVEALRRNGGGAFASGGSLAAQAVLLLTVRDVSLGESTFAYPHILTGKKGSSQELFTEDLLRLVLMLGLLIGVLLKLGGVL